ncbi:MAG: transposase family protein [Candidatus Saccharibacteria bacterium]|nr:transposase family protein [Pseudorhodobacter sp.]
MLAHLRTHRFADQTPTEVYATLLDEGVCPCSIQTIASLPPMAKLRNAAGCVANPDHQKPELLTEGPYQEWSWDITKLMGPMKWSYSYLYVILDIFSRRVAGWRIEHAESASQFKALFKDAMTKHAVPLDQLTLHADRGGPLS